MPAGSRRCCTSTVTSRSSSAATTGRSKASRPARPPGSPASACVAPRECVELYDAVQANDLATAREVYRRMLPVARFDMTSKLVQYFKAAQDAVGLHGGPTRAPRLPLKPAEVEALRTPPWRSCASRRWRELRAARYFAAVDSHTEGMPTRVVTGGVGTIPGATMLERKLHFETRMDELRQLLMREPRGHGAMSGAILQPPSRPDADWGVIYIEVSGLPADVRPRHHRRGDGAGRDGHGRGHRARDRDPAGRARRAWSRPAWRWRTAARSRSRSATSPPSCTRPTASSRSRARPGHLRHGLRRELLRAHPRPPTRAWSSTPHARAS